MAKKLIVANWKMNPQSIKDAEQIFTEIGKFVKNFKNIQIVVCPPAIFLSNLKKKNNKKIILGAQDVFYEKEGAYTGEISANQIKSIGAKYVIIGHSEKRNTGDTNSIVNKKILISLKSELIPILCVGEITRDHNGFYLAYIKTQIHECLENVTKSQMKNIVIAYEPIWAIGRDAVREATATEFTEMSIYIKKIISDMFDSKIAHDTAILYGGSVHKENTKEFLFDGNAGGLLIGRDSLNPKKFSAIAGLAGKK